MGVIKNVAYLITLVDLAFLTLLGLPGRWLGRSGSGGGLERPFLFKFVLKLYHFWAFGRIWPFLGSLGLSGGVFWVVLGRWAGRGPFFFKVVLKPYHFGTLGRIWPFWGLWGFLGGCFGSFGAAGLREAVWFVLWRRRVLGEQLN